VGELAGVSPKVVANIGRKYTKMTGGRYSKTFLNLRTPESQKMTATRVARKANTDIGSVKTASDVSVIGSLSPFQVLGSLLPRDDGPRSGERRRRGERQWERR
jgi:hypothetical protein